MLGKNIEQMFAKFSSKFEVGFLNEVPIMLLYKEHSALYWVSEMWQTIITWLISCCLLR